MSRLAILDWGVGGLGFYRAWRRLRPKEAVVYVSDSDHTPYGETPAGPLASRLSEIFRHLHSELEVSHGVIACNAASTALEALELPEGMEVEGVIVPAAAYVREHIAPGELTIVGGQRTVESRLFSQLLPGYTVEEAVAQPWSALVEAGRLQGEEVEQRVREVLEGTRAKDLLLACTHYVALGPVIAHLFPSLRQHDPIPSTAAALDRRWDSFQEGEPLLFTTGDPRAMESSARQAFGISIHARKAPWDTGGQGSPAAS